MKMKMDPKIRVSVSKDAFSHYDVLTKTFDIESHTLFILCFCLAIARGIKPEPLGKGSEKKFWSSTFSHEEWTTMYAVLLETNKRDFSIIQDDDEVIRQAEQYANAGLQVLLKDFLVNKVTHHNDKTRVVIDDPIPTIMKIVTGLMCELPK